MNEPLAAPIAIYSRLLEGCSRWIPDDPWRENCDCCVASLGAYTGPEDPAATLALLQAEFAPDALQDAGVVHVSETGDVSLVPEIQRPDAILIPLRATATSEPFDIVMSRGCLSGRLPVLQALEDVLFKAARYQDMRPPGASLNTSPRNSSPTLEWAEDSCVNGDDEICEPVFRDDATIDDTMLVTGSVADAAILRGLGFPAVPIGGLDVIRRERLDEVSAALAYAVGEQPDWPPQLVLVDWCVTTQTQDLSRRMDPLRVHLIALKRYCHMQFEAPSLWRLREDKLEALRFAVQTGTRCRVRHAITRSIEESCEPLEKDQSIRARAFDTPDSLAGSSLQMSYARDSAAGAEARKRAWHHYQQAIEERCITPLLVEAERQPDPVQASLLVAFADTARNHHMLAKQSAENYLDYLKRLQSRIASLDEFPQAQFQEQSRLADQLINFAKVIFQRRKPHRVINVMANQPTAALPEPSSPAARPRLSPAIDGMWRNGLAEAGDSSESFGIRRAMNPLTSLPVNPPMRPPCESPAAGFGTRREGDPRE